MTRTVKTYSSAADASAELSACGRYRHRLVRRWDDGDVVAWLMLNPSTADATADDPTIRRRIAFSKSRGHGALVVLNLFAYRATDPRRLPREYESAVGPDNDEWIAANVAERRVVCAWGCHGKRFGRGREVAASIATIAREVVCLGTTKDGHPRHPLYVAGTQPRIAFPG